MSLLQRMMVFGAIILAVFALNLIAQKLFPTKTTDPYGQKVAFNGLVYLLFVGALALAVVIGLALSR